jgi:hypothetical protein
MRLVKLIAAFVLIAITCGACSQQMGIIGPVILSQEVQKDSKYPVFWPPKAGSKYPDLHLTDTSGHGVNLSKFEGRVVLIEEIAMTCGACNAFCGANRSGSKGAYPGGYSQKGLPAIDDYLRESGVDISNPNYVKIDLIIYNTRLQAATPEDARAWCEHFKIVENKNHVVLVGDKSLLGNVTFSMIPGFQLLDKSFVLCSDSVGHEPKDDLWTVLVPKLKRLL